MMVSLLISWLPVVTVFLALVVQETALPFAAWGVFRPDFLVITLFYWRMYRPDRCGPILAFSVGLTLDLISASNLGIHALSKVILVLLVGHYGKALRAADFVFLLPIVLVLVILDQSIHLLWTMVGHRMDLSWEVLVGRPLATVLVAPCVVWLLILVHRSWLGDR